MNHMRHVYGGCFNTVEPLGRGDLNTVALLGDTLYLMQNVTFFAPEGRDNFSF